ncbi:ubiquinol-cytochrome-c reductase complex assembly factor 2-like [Anopheles albimanus]|uniref:Mitochondrial nucleoid factor 1 n=1 Tax=Anopheles albimanus TaxID=7167 RepID=A0A182F764_ANOAL|nr:ubiquinol-cytochrome-c reductase complex assembly factor 2-like [Anopheles albimanus]
MSQHYKNFLSLLERWPLDKSKVGRDLGQYLRDQLKAVLGSSNIIAVKDERLNGQFRALENIVNDVHAKKYPRTLSSTATGLSGEQCREVLSTEFLQILQNRQGSKKEE